ncbi:MAG: WbqC family protein [Flavobacterium sp.]|nr:WbqC family protein [Flavobacterium sp.]
MHKDKTIAIMQPYFFPYIGYFQLINAVDRFIVYDDVNFINKGWINRNSILSNGDRLLITLPLDKSSQNKLINEIEIAKDEKWKLKTLKSIQSLYSKAPFFKEIFPVIESLIASEQLNLATFNFHLLKTISNFLAIETEFVLSSQTYQNQNLKAQDRILDICKVESCSRYINPIGGVALYDKEVFLKNNIQLYFLQTQKIEYKQYKNEFVPWLSIIDVMMFNTKEEVQKMLTQYTLV